MTEETREKAGDRDTKRQVQSQDSSDVVHQDIAMEDDTVKLVMQYDEQAKKILGYKTILAFILSKAVTEFKHMQPKDIKELIEGEILINRVPVDPGRTNKAKGERITGFNTENAETNEGLIKYDILFKVRTGKDSEDAYGIIINIDYSDFRLIPINLFWGLYFSPFRYIYRNKFFSSL